MLSRPTAPGPSFDAVMASDTGPSGCGSRSRDADDSSSLKIERLESTPVLAKTQNIRSFAYCEPSTSNAALVVEPVFREEHLKSKFSLDSSVSSPSEPGASYAQVLFDNVVSFAKKLSCFPFRLQLKTFRVHGLPPT